MVGLDLQHILYNYGTLRIGSRGFGNQGIQSCPLQLSCKVAGQYHELNVSKCFSVIGGIKFKN